MAITINWGTSIITIPKADLTLIQLNPVEIREMNLDWFRLQLKDLEDDLEGMPFLKTHTHNTEVSLGGLTYARVIEILDPYTITFEDGQYAVNLVGANSNVGDKVNVNQVSVRSANSAGLISTPLIEQSSFQEVVTIDVVNGSPGTLFPIGTPKKPSNNIADTLLIANERGFERIHIHGDLTLGSGHIVDGFVFEGDSPSKTLVTIEDTASTIGCEFYEISVQGVLDGNTVFERCVIYDINYVEGRIYLCTLMGVITLSGTTPTRIYNCFDGTPGYDNNPIVDMGGSGRGLSIGAFTGGIDIKNKTGTEIVDINLLTGRIIIQDTVTNGTIYCRGIGRVIDDSTGSANVVKESLYITDIEYLLNKIKNAVEITTASINDVGATTVGFITTLTETTNDFWKRASILFTSGNNQGLIRGIRGYVGSTKTIQIETPLPFAPTNGDGFTIIANRKHLSPESYNGKIVYDSVNGIAGTNYPVGTHEYPVNNINDLLTIVADRKIDSIMLHTSLTVESGQDISNMSVSTHGIMGVTVTLEPGCVVDSTVFRYLNLEGTVSNTDVLLVENCSIYNLVNFTGIMQGVSFAQGCEISIGTWAEIYNCRAGGEPGNEPEISIGNATLNIQQYRGNLKLTDKTGDNRTVAGFLPGNVTIDSTCVAGKIQILGIGEIEADNSGAGCQVDIDAAITNEHIADAVWDELLSEHTANNSFGLIVSDMIKLLGFKIVRVADVITIYEADGNTIWRTYNVANDGRIQT